MVNEPSVFEPSKFYFIWIVVEQGPTVLAVSAGGVCLNIFMPRDDSQGAFRFAPVCPSVCPSVRPFVTLYGIEFV